VSALGVLMAIAVGGQKRRTELWIVEVDDFQLPTALEFLWIPLH
jgi:hypothetical protein